MITVYRGSDYIEAQLLAGLLRQQGIEVFLQGALLQGALGELPPVGHLAIMVHDDDRSAAERLISAYDRGEFMLDDEEPDEGDA